MQSWKIEWSYFILTYLLDTFHISTYWSRFEFFLAFCSFVLSNNAEAINFVKFEWIHHCFQINSGSKHVNYGNAQANGRSKQVNYENIGQSDGSNQIVVQENVKFIIFCTFLARNSANLKGDGAPCDAKLPCVLFLNCLHFFAIHHQKVTTWK